MICNQLKPEQGLVLSSLRSSLQIRGSPLAEDAYRP